MSDYDPPSCFWNKIKRWLPMREIVFTRRTILLLMTGIGLVLFWRGIWEVSAKLFSDEISLVVGLSILVSVAVYERRQIFQFFGGGK